MPFTASHAAAVLPLLGTRLPASALVIGSMAPDLPYFVPVAPDLRTHTGVAIATTDLVVGAVAWLLWHGLLAAPALAAAPRTLRARLAGGTPGIRSRLRSGPDVLLVAVGLVLGSATHVLWDEFTHERSWGPQHLPALAADWGPLPDIGAAGFDGTAWGGGAALGVAGVLALGWHLRRSAVG